MNEDKHNKDRLSEEDFVFEDDDEIVGEESQADKIKNLRQKLKACSDEKQKLQQDLQRAKADFVNMRRRDEADLERALKLANEGLFLEIIPVLDSFDLAMNHNSWNEAPPDFKKGIERVYDQLRSVLTKNGVEVSDPKGEKFDPNLHEAVQVRPTDKEEDDHTIEEVMQKGYILNHKVIRSPKVIIKEFHK